MTAKDDPTIKATNPAGADVNPPTKELAKSLEQLMSPARDRSAPQAMPSSAAEILAEVSAIRRQICVGGLNTSTALNLIATRSLERAKASGMAIALRAGSDVICCASAGIAPEVGVRMDAEGLSGECFRTGKMVRCDDTRRDPRIDPATSRALNLRSALMLPIRCGAEVIGVFGIFSEKPSAFDDRTVATLTQIADFLGGFVGHATVPLTPAGIASPEAITESGPDVGGEGTSGIHDAAPVAPPSSAAARNNRARFANRILRYKYLAAAVVVVVLAATLYAVHRVRRANSDGTAGESSATPLVAGGAQPEQPVAPPTSASEATIPADSVPAEAVIAVPEKPKHKVSPPLSRQDPPARVVIVDAASTRIRRISLPAPKNPGQATPPPALGSVAGPEREGVRAALTAVPAVTPKVAAADIRDWPEVEGGELVHKVNPVYPQAARTAHLSGTVVLRATIGRDGYLHDVTVASGNPVLAEAAVGAVSKWRYTPYTLHGNAVEVATEITTKFGKGGVFRHMAKPVTVFLPKGGQKESAGTPAGAPEQR